MEAAYRIYTRKKALVIALLAVGTALVATSAISAGAANLSILDVLRTLLGQGNKQANIVVFNIRLPRVVTAIVAGAGLGITGCVMQAVLKNPLASASTMGISQGAAFGAAFAIIALGAGMQNQTLDGVTISNPYLVSVCAFAFSMLSTLIVLGLSRIARLTPEAMVLSGVALSSLFSGGTTLLQYFAEDVKVAAVVFWTFGDLGRTSWREVAIMSAMVFASYVYFSLTSWNLNALASGEDTATGLGVHVESTRLIGMLLCSLTASAIVSFVGIINFIGLIAPHIIRRYVGADYRYLMPASALTGAIILLLSDTAARLIVSPVILPIGAITSFLGAPLFLYLLFKGVARK